ncbi:Tetratricopeptide repeat 7A [Gossypium australe]|uniref:Tetratricopeptide repeat 7A n=1 Tax=Gossypium australe TaxID=47621 RepID=A0A5B6UXI2_9ROSI|nr:Tetratricopeptide repeat 7A [Gossypium australe]
MKLALYIQVNLAVLMDNLLIDLVDIIDALAMMYEAEMLEHLDIGHFLDMFTEHLKSVVSSTGEKTYPLDEMIVRKKGEKGSRELNGRNSRILIIIMVLIVRLTNIPGFMHQERGEIQEALASYINASLLDPFYVPSKVQIGALLSKLGSNSLPVARTLLSDALRIEPTNRKAWYHLGMVHKDDGRLADAIDCLQAASMLEESDPPRGRSSTQTMIHTGVSFVLFPVSLLNVLGAKKRRNQIKRKWNLKGNYNQTEGKKIPDLGGSNYRKCGNRGSQVVFLMRFKDKEGKELIVSFIHTSFKKDL